MLLPLFAMLGVAGLAPVLEGITGALISGLVISLGIFGLFDSYLVRSIDTVQENLKLLALPALMVLLGLGYWFLSNMWILVVLIPLSLSLLVIPRIGSELQFSRVRLPAACSTHREIDASGFCFTCGRKFASARNQTPSGVAGLIIAIILLGILLTVQIPILILGSSGPNSSVYSVLRCYKSGNTFRTCRMANQ